MVAVPADSPVTIPLLFTVAIDVAPDDHVPPLVPSVNEDIVLAQNVVVPEITLTEGKPLLTLRITWPE